MAASRDRSTASVSVPHERSSVSVARHAFADDLQASGVLRTDREDAVLVLSELVSNAIKHAEPLPTGEIQVRWAISRECLHIEITDGGATTRPHAGVAAVSALGGRGLDIVRSVSAQWGVTEDDRCVTVWADVPRGGRRAAEAPGPDRRLRPAGDGAAEPGDVDLRHEDRRPASH
jgi:anti-sigma regulatory factor (Ser/Thr protein kinase)